MEVYSYDVCSTYLSYLEMCCDITLKCHGATFADFGIQNVKSVCHVCTPVAGVGSDCERKANRNHKYSYDRCKLLASLALA